MTAVLEKVQAQLTHLQKRLSVFEKQYSWFTPKFYEQFEQGKIGDEADFFEWSATWEIVQELKQEMALLS